MTDTATDRGPECDHVLRRGLAIFFVTFCSTLLIDGYWFPRGHDGIIVILGIWTFLCGVWGWYGANEPYLAAPVRLILPVCATLAIRVSWTAALRTEGVAGLVGILMATLYGVVLLDQFIRPTPNS